MPKLDKKHIEKIQKSLPIFIDYLDSQSFEELHSQALDNARFIRAELPKLLNSFSENDFIELFARLWSSSMFKNVVYRANKIITANGLEKIASEIEHLLDRNAPVEKRFNRFIKSIKYLGAATATEIMCLNEPSKCGIWNTKSIQGLIRLDLIDLLGFKHMLINGSQYEKFNQLSKEIGDILIKLGVEQELNKHGIASVDLMIVDHFLYSISVSEEAKIEKQKRDSDLGFEFIHNDVRDKVAQIGDFLGFDYEVEFKIAHGAQVDVIWRTKIGNLGIVTYVFEVHKSGSIDSLILNLMKALKNPTVHKVIAISDREQLNQIEKETEELDEKFRRMLVLWDVIDVIDAWEKLKDVNELIGKLGLTADPFAKS